MAIDEDPTTPMPKKEKTKKEKKEEKKDEKKKGKDEEKDLSKEKDFLSDLTTDRNAARSKARVRPSAFLFFSPFSFLLHRSLLPSRFPLNVPPTIQAPCSSLLTSLSVVAMVRRSVLLAFSRTHPCSTLVRLVLFSVFASCLIPSLVDNHAVQNVYVTDVLARAHRALAAFRSRAETEDSLREVRNDIKSQMVRAIHRVSVEVTFFETLNKEFGLVQGSLAQLSQPAASGSGSSPSN